jgi:hypothetical protein
MKEATRRQKSDGLNLISRRTGAPFFIVGMLKWVYDLGLYRLFRRVPLGLATSQ